jgi:succinylglutamate desuccinylase
MTREELQGRHTLDDASTSVFDFLSSKGHEVSTLSTRPSSITVTISSGSQGHGSCTQSVGKMGTGKDLGKTHFSFKSNRSLPMKGLVIQLTSSVGTVHWNA